MTFTDIDAFLNWVGSKILWIAGLTGAVAAACIGQAELIGEPWHHYLSIAGILSTAIVAYLLPQYRNPTTQGRVGDPPKPPSL